MSKEGIDVTLAGTRIRVPIFKDEETTVAIVERVQSRLEDISKTGRVNTQAWALQTALSFAIEVEEVKQAADDEARLLDKRLKTLTQRLNALTDPPGITRLGT